MSELNTPSDFLKIIPTEVRDFTLPTYSMEFNEDMLGLETRRVISEDGKNTEITVFYNHLNEEEVNLLINFYNDRVPQGRGFGLPQGLLTYDDRLFQEYLSTLGQVLYYFKQRPVITTNQVSGTYSVILYLEAKSVFLNAPGQVTVILSSTATLSVDTTVPFVKWEQISGQELIISDPFSITTTITAASGNITNLLGDIIVRVSLIDNPDIFVDVSVNARPVDTTRIAISGRNSYINEIPLVYSVPLPIQWDYTSPTGTATQYDDEGVAFAPFTAKWREPVFSEFLLRYEIEYWNGTEWVLQVTIPAGESRTYTGFDANQTFRILAVHRLPGAASVIKASSGVLLVDPPEATDDIIGASDTFRSVGGDRVFIIETDIDRDFKGTILDARRDDEIFHASYRGSNTLIIETDFAFTKDILDVEEDNFYAQQSGSIVFITETDFDLGGGVIG